MVLENQHSRFSSEVNFASANLEIIFRKRNLYQLFFILIILTVENPELPDFFVVIFNNDRW